MESIKSLKKKVGSLKNTRKITKAMKMISANKLRKAQLSAVASIPYYDSLKNVFQVVASNTEKIQHPFIEQNKEILKTNDQKIGLLICSSDKGLCGSFNSGLFKIVNQFFNNNVKDPSQVTYSLVGKKSVIAFNQSNNNVQKIYEDVIKNPSYEDAEKIAHDLQKNYLNGECTSIYIVYNHFKSALSQIPTVKRILPLMSYKEIEEVQKSQNTDYILEPKGLEMLDQLAFNLFSFSIYTGLLNSVASEHAFRMSAMDTATNNASELIEDYTVKMNRARQSAITTELTEIISGAESI